MSQTEIDKKNLPEIDKKNLQDFLAAFKESPDKLSRDAINAAQKLFNVPSRSAINKKYNSELEAIIDSDDRFYKKIRDKYDKCDFERFIINEIVADLEVPRDNNPNLDNTIILARYVFYMQLFDIRPTGNPLQKTYTMKKIEGLSVYNDILLILVFIFLIVVLRWNLDTISLEIRKMISFLRGLINGCKPNESYSNREHPSKKISQTNPAPEGTVPKQYALVLLLGGDAPGLEGKKALDDDVFELVDEYCEYYRIVEKAENIQPIPYNEGDMPMYWLQMVVLLHSIPIFKFFDHVEAFMKEHRGDKITIKKVSFASRKGFDKV